MIVSTLKLRSCELKRGYLGVLESAFLAGKFDGGISDLEEQEHKINKNVTPIEKMLFVSAFQGGINEFVTMIDPKVKYPGDQFLINRLKQPNESSAKIIPEVIEVFNRYVSEEESQKVVMIMSFVSDLIMAMKNNASVLNVSGIPSISKVKKDLPPELSIPIINIISQLKSTNVLLPVPSSTVEKDEVNRLRIILESNTFSTYAISHKNLEEAAIDKNKTIEDIKRKGLILLEKGKDILSSKCVSFNIIPVMPKIVDVAFGKFPGLLSQIAGDSAMQLLKNKKSIVIYQFSDWATEYIHMYKLNSKKNNE